MPTEDGTGALMAEIRADSQRKGSCSVCEWIEDRDDADEWDAVMALPWQDANSKAIWRAMAKRGYGRGDKPVDEHRRKGHRVSD